MLATLSIKKNIISLQPNTEDKLDIPLYITNEHIYSPINISSIDNIINIKERGKYSLSINIRLTITPLQNISSENIKGILEIRRNGSILEESSGEILGDILEICHYARKIRLNKEDNITINLYLFGISGMYFLNINRICSSSFLIDRIYA